MAEIWSGVKSERRPDGLAALAEEAKRGLAFLNFPAANWVPPVKTPAGRPMLDVLVVGGGMCGQTLGYALMRDGVRNVRIVDRARRGDEGPWATFARMEILRSPKHLTGPDLGVPALTFRAWYEAQHGLDGWQSLHKIGRIDWRDYLLWVRDTVGVPVENDTEVRSISPNADGVEVILRRAGREEAIAARKVVLAMGRDGSGGARLPRFPGLESEATGGGRVHHAEVAIDFGRVAGKRVAVLGGGATAFDCAATALEAGAGEVALFVRRPHLPQVNKSKWMSFPGCFKAFGALDDEARWRFLTFVFDEQVPPPYESVLRCDRHAGFKIRFGEGWRDVVARGDGLDIETTSGQRERFDMAVLATGFDVDLAMRPEFASFVGNVMLWGDRMGPAKAAENAETARFPYLGSGFELQPRDAARTPGLNRVHLFNWGSTLSHGALAGDIPGLATGIARLSEALCRDLFLVHADVFWQTLQVHEDPELKPTSRYVPPAERRRS